MKDLFVVKFGGSLITKKTLDFPNDYDKIVKNSDKYIRFDVIEGPFDKLYRFHKKEPFNLILITGAGCFGHGLVKDFLKGKEVGPETIHKSVKLLNSKVCKLAEEKFSVTTIDPYETCFYEKGNFDTEKLEKEAERGLEKTTIVSTYGDIVHADKGRLGKFEVISGDDICVNLSLKFKPERVVMVTDVDGVYNKDPKGHPDAKLIKILDSSKLVEYSKSSDVTGGMSSKVKKLSRIAGEGINCYIINGLKENSLFDVLSGKEVGTKIV